MTTATTSSHASPPSPDPTLQFYGDLQRAFDFFNARLFDAALPPCLLTLRSASREFGYHHTDRFIDAQGRLVDELALHPGFFTLRPVEEVLATLVHEMAHHWQAHFGRESKSNPHNREWAGKMRELGLQPSSTGLPEGRQTGRSMTHYIVPEGRFIQACRELLAGGFALRWFDRHAPRTGYDSAKRQQQLRDAGVAVAVSPEPAHTIKPISPDVSVVIEPPPARENDRVRYQCPTCDTRAWAKAGTDLRCGNCDVELISE